MNVEGYTTDHRQRSDYVRHYTCNNLDEIKLHTDASIMHMLMNMAAKVGTMSATQFEKLQQMYGFSYTPHCISMQGYGLKCISHTCMDWMHTWVVSGIFALELGALMCLLAKN